MKTCKIVSFSLNIQANIILAQGLINTVTCNNDFFSSLKRFIIRVFSRSIPHAFLKSHVHQIVSTKRNRTHYKTRFVFQASKILRSRLEGNTFSVN